jgi:DNA-directed RNA polymerase specialized sigma24 family protein
MEGDDRVWRKAREEAMSLMRRYQDPWTRSHRDDIVQETSLAAWRWANRIRHPERLWAAVQTIARRVRQRGLRAKQRRPPLSSAWTAVDDQEPRDCHYLIAGRRVAGAQARPWLRQALSRLQPIDRDLLLGFYEGFCCSELAERFCRSLPCVKTRIHRARVRVQKDVETSARIADGLDD